MVTSDRCRLRRHVHRRREGYTEVEPEESDEEMVQWGPNTTRRKRDHRLDGAPVGDGAGDRRTPRGTGIDWHGLRMEKGNADVYVDDKGAIPEEDHLDDGYDGDGEIDGSEEKNGRHEDASDN